MNKKGALPLLAIIVVLSLVGVGALILTGNINVGSVADAGTLNYDYVYKANYGHLCCLSGPYETLAGPRYADDVQTTSCSEYVDKCDLIIRCAEEVSGAVGYCKVEYNECDLDGSNCIKRSYSVGNKDTKQLLLPSGKKATFLKNSIIFDDRKYYTWERKGEVYDLIGEEDGKIFVSNGCELSNSLKGAVLSGVPNTVPKGYSNCINYVIDFSLKATKIYSYERQSVVCQARAVYGIDTQKFLSGDAVKIMGEKIADVECCPSESNCGSDFKFRTNAQKECTYSYECNNAGELFGITQTTAGYYVCESGKCVKKTKSVECTGDQVCQQRYGEGYVCSVSEATWGECIEAPTGPYCGDGYCDVGSESKSSCPKDCELECMEDEKLVTKEKRVDCFIGFPLYIGCEKEVSKYCESAKSTNWLLWILIGLVFILLLTQWRKIMQFFKIVFRI